MHPTRAGLSGTNAATFERNNTGSKRGLAGLPCTADGDRHAAPGRAGPDEAKIDHGGSSGDEDLNDLQD